MNTATITSQPERVSTRYRVLAAISSAHFLNDMMQSLILALYPMLKGNYHLSFAQLGLITLTYQITASILQPLIGAVTDKRPQQYSLVLGMGFTLVGLLLLSQADSFPLILLAAGLVGTGSSIFHPESSRIARFASGGLHGLAQSLFQVGGNAGSATGPLLAALIVIPLGQPSLAWFSLAALLAMGVLWRISLWYSHQQKTQGHKGNAKTAPFTARKTLWVMGVLLTLLMTKFVYMASFQSYYTFYLIERFSLAPQQAQLLLFVFLFAVALGTVLGGPIGDRIGRKTVIWFSILGAAPFSIALPYVGLTGTITLSFIVGLIMSSAFSAMLVYAQELMPGKVGMVSGLFFGLAFGIAGIGAAVIGRLADNYGIINIYLMLAYLPLLGMVAGLLPKIEHTKN
ncbi:MULTISPECIES: MFS transporter [Deefgea]|uniref:MFS transporter n=1 Tax=Deefgea chitinilytica TaxID=570276 RepID=A0ABS2CFH0_9NEIS|nr:MULTISPECIES: MFS transporter [Deefgea]MBM5572136.1 MFS transporter [Deefgea chitinilytica]MBM9889371.1 MFS transporter [Deefgea sp. CFH1-16]